jgi:hypothetical protein
MTREIDLIEQAVERYRRIDAMLASSIRPSSASR